jgi:hypothetical protein
VGCARRRGIEVIDTWAPISEVYQRDRKRFDDLFIFHGSHASHMSAAGNRLVAEVIASRLHPMGDSPAQGD